MSSFTTSIGGIAITLGAAGAMIGSIDFFLSKTQRDAINKVSLRIWYWLSSQNQMKKVESLRSEDTFFWLVVLGPTLPGVLTLRIGSVVSGVPLVLLALFYMKSEKIKSLLYKWYIFSLTGNNVAIIAVRSLIIYLVFLLIYGATLLGIAFLVGSFAPEIIAAIIVIGLTWIIAPFALVGGLVGFVLWTLLIWTFLGLIYGSAELVVLKIVEYEKGAVLGASAVLTAAGIFLKTVS